MERRFAWVYPDQAKARKAIPVPLNDVAFAVVRRQACMHGRRAFTYNGKPIDRGSTSAWYRAVKRGEFSVPRPPRCLGVSWRVQSRTPLFALQELAGCETERMVRRYAHLADDHLAPYAQRMGESHVANLAHAQNEGSSTE
jgi:hypothetical protein